MKILQNDTSILILRGLWPHHDETLVPIRSSKLSNIERGLYLDGLRFGIPVAVGLHVRVV